MSSQRNPDKDIPRSIARGKTIYIVKDIGNDHFLLTPNNRGNKGESKVSFKRTRSQIINTLEHLQ